MAAYRNRYDRTGESSQMGASAEENFEKLALEKGFVVEKATRKQNLSHIDFIVTKHDKTFFVDVKACKKSSRSAQISDAEIVWIEFTNVAGNVGWVNGAADYIAFEREQDFVIVPRSNLVALCDRIVNKKNKVDSARDALYNLYTRQGRKDEISLIKMSDITENIKVAYWSKNGSNS
jgi:hypothetical protein